MKKWLATIVVGFAIVISSATVTDAYSTKGNQIVDERGQPVFWNGLNWFGFETHNYAPHGLWTRTMDEMLDQAKAEGYNLFRIPYSNDIFKQVTPNGIDFYKNSELQGKTPLQILDILIREAGERDMYVLLDRHRPDANGQSELWYTSAVSEVQWIADWVTLAKRYKGNDTVIGADLHNEPHGQASWGTGNMATDWRLAAERVGNAILAVNPNWLIVVEGVERNVQGEGGNYWWGGNLKGVRNNPVRLNTPNKVVYSTHDYGQGVYYQLWFSEHNFPSNMPAIWNEYWGYIHKEQIAPVLIGEFGGRNTSMTTNEGQWQHALVQYIKENGLYWTYWALNPNSGDTGGLLKDDWYTWNLEKQMMLQPIMRQQKTYSGTFNDVADDHLFFSVIEKMVASGYIGGYPEGSFKPNANISREHVAVTLHRKHQFPKQVEYNAFYDVPLNDSSYSAIVHLAEANILNGYSTGEFKPKAPISRAEIAKVVVQAFDLKLNAHAVPSFVDVSPEKWYTESIHILASNGFMNGYNDYFRPNEPITRAEFVAVLARIVEQQLQIN